MVSEVKRVKFIRIISGYRTTLNLIEGPFSSNTGDTTCSRFAYSMFNLETKRSTSLIRTHVNNFDQVRVTIPKLWGNIRLLPEFRCSGGFLA